MMFTIFHAFPPDWNVTFGEPSVGVWSKRILPSQETILQSCGGNIRNASGKEALWRKENGQKYHGSPWANKSSQSCSKTELISPHSLQRWKDFYISFKGNSWGRFVTFWGRLLQDWKRNFTLLKHIVQYLNEADLR